MVSAFPPNAKYRDADLLVGGTEKNAAAAFAGVETSVLVYAHRRPPREAAHAGSPPDRRHGARVSPAHLLISLEHLGAQALGDPAALGVQSRRRSDDEAEGPFLFSQGGIVKILEKGIDLLKPQKISY